MADVIHSNLTDPDLHEPKGVAAAAKGDVYVADGAGSGNMYQLGSGWGYYKGDGAGQTIGTTATKMTCDGAGATSETGYLPLAIRGSSDLWNTSTNKITPIQVGDAYNLRLDLPITAKGGSPSILTMQLDIGGGASPSIVIVERDISVSKTAPFNISVGFPIFCLTTFVTNGGQIFLKTDSGTVTVTKPAIYLALDHSGGM